MNTNSDLFKKCNINLVTEKEKDIYAKEMLNKIYESDKHADKL